jgi:hypothetical protein
MAAPRTHGSTVAGAWDDASARIGYHEVVNDTHPAAEAVQLDLLRRAGVTRRATIALRLSQDVVERSRRALRNAMPGATEADVRLRWVELWYGAELAGRIQTYLASRRSGPEA